MQFMEIPSTTLRQVDRIYIMKMASKLKSMKMLIGRLANVVTLYQKWSTNRASLIFRHQPKLD